MPMDNFFKVRVEKQNHIINAAFVIFGRQGYRKASLSDIAKIAGITKGMITYYFGSKKTLYLYLLEICQSLLLDAVKERINDNTDFFTRLQITVEVQVKAMKEHPGLLSFTNSIYKESDPEVMTELDASIISDQKQYDFLYEGIDEIKFKPGFDPKLICRFILWAGSGFAEELHEMKYTREQLEKATSDFYECIKIMRETFTEINLE